MLRAIVLALGAAFATFAVAAICFAILDIYLAGHGRASPMQQMLISRPGARLSVADAIALAVSAVVGGITFVASYRR